MYLLIDVRLVYLPLPKCPPVEPPPGRLMPLPLPKLRVGAELEPPLKPPKLRVGAFMERLGADDALSPNDLVRLLLLSPLGVNVLRGVVLVSPL